MNCKPGDLAVYVLGDVFAIPENVGRLFKVVVRDAYQSAEEGELWWEVECLDRALGADREWCTPGELGCVPDKHLRPISDPGDDAKDETLAWKSVPRKALIPLKVRGEVRAE